MLFRSFLHQEGVLALSGHTPFDSKTSVTVYLVAASFLVDMRSKAVKYGWKETCSFKASKAQDFRSFLSVGQITIEYFPPFELV
eukprot:3986590-Amphidinium_carterae.2